MPSLRPARAPAILGAALLSLALAGCQAMRSWDDEARRVVALADVAPGAAVADVGTGDGGLAFALAEHLGPESRVYATEVEPDLVQIARSAVAARRLANVTVIEGAVAETRLPEGCCDAVVLRAVYHHLTQPETMGVSLRRALKPGGRLIVIDFPPSAEADATEGPVENREGHGVTAELVVSELERAGLERVRVVDTWNRDGWYAALMRRPQ
jgi:ubiquinone/menaquinone biosynthesis C-methylase UbiE